jgi:hypothetical protein
MARPEFDNISLDREYAELTADEKEELKGTYFWSEDNTEYEDSDDIPESVLEKHFGGIHFVPDDFFCNQ